MVFYINEFIESHVKFLENPSERVSVNNTFSSWEEIRAGVPQGSIPGTLFA